MYFVSHMFIECAWLPLNLKQEKAYFIQQTTRLNAFYSHNLFTRSVNYEICYGFDIYNSIYRLNLISREITKIWFILYILVSKTRYVQPVCLLFIV